MGFIKKYFSDKNRINRILLNNHKEISATLREIYSEQQGRAWGNYTTSNLKPPDASGLNDADIMIGGGGIYATDHKAPTLKPWKQPI